VQMESTFHPRRSATYSEGERQLSVGLAGGVQVDVLALPALVICALALREERRHTNRGVRGAERGDRVLLPTDVGCECAAREERERLAEVWFWYSEGGGGRHGHWVALESIIGKR